jgi:lipoprotein-releasing system permease protein
MLAPRLALRFLSSNKGQTALIAIGIAIAISVQVFVGTLIISLQKGLLDDTIGRSPHISITSADDNITINNWEGLVTTAQGVGGVTVVSVSVDTNAFAIKGNRSEPVLIRGFDINNNDKIYHINSAIYQGKSPAKGQVLMGKDLQLHLGSKIGDVLSIDTAKGTRTNLTISGLYDLSVSSINMAWLITDLGTARTVFGYGNIITALELRVKDPFTADTVAKKVSLALNDPHLKVVNWKAQNKALLSGLQAQSASSGLIQGFILVSVIITIASILAITVLQKSKQIGILKAMGIKDRDASLIFLIQGSLLGLIGSILGLTFGIGILVAFITFAKSSPLKLSLDYIFLLESWIIAMVSSTFAGLLPARRSASLSPIEVIRNG